MKVVSCRLCKGSLSEPVLKFPDTPLANEFLSTQERQETFPLQVCVCRICGHYQLNETVDPERLFRHYVFVAGTSKVNVEHFRQYAEDVIKSCQLKVGSSVLDIASNDGTLLRHFHSMGMSVMGIDPARNLAEAATANGILTLPEFFTEDYANTIASRHGTFDLITANNVFAHVPDMIGFAKGVKKILKPHGTFTFEVSYFLDVCDHVLFDTVYHEHSSYHTIGPLVSFFQSLDMDLYRVERIGTHGGSIRVFVKHASKEYWPDREKDRKSTVHSLVEAENTIATKVRELNQNIRLLGLELREQIRNIKAAGHSIAIYGTPAKATTLMYALGIDEKDIAFAVDDNPLKQNTFTPGKHIPVMPSSALTTWMVIPDYLLILAWNFADSIIENCKRNGYTGKFIVPLPELKVVQ